MSIEWVDVSNHTYFHSEISNDVEIEPKGSIDGANNVVEYRLIPKSEAPESDSSNQYNIGYELAVNCPDCNGDVLQSEIDEHRQVHCTGGTKRNRKRKMVGADEVTTCHICSEEYAVEDLVDHYAHCRPMSHGIHEDSSSSSTKKKARTKSKFSSRKVIDIVEIYSNDTYKSRVPNESEKEDEDESLVVCPECNKVFKDCQGRDEHLVYAHHYHFRIRFQDRETFQHWFKGMRFDQIMYKANMSTVNNVTYEYYFCLHTAVNRRVRIRDRCPCRAFVKENHAGITVSYLDVHSHPQLKFKRYMTDECRTLILSMLDQGKCNKVILQAIRDQFSESSINYTIARTTINSIRFKFKKRMWAAKNLDIDVLQSTLNEEVARERRKMAALWPNEGEEELCDFKDCGTQTTFSVVSQPPEMKDSIASKEDRTAIQDYLFRSVLPSLESAMRNPEVTPEQLHAARIHLSKVITDLNPWRRIDIDHDYTYLCDQ